MFTSQHQPLPRLETFQATDRHRELIAAAAHARTIRTLLRRRKAARRGATPASNFSAEFVATRHG